MRRDTVAVVIPAYNEVKMVQMCVKSVYRAFEYGKDKKKMDYKDLIIVSDGGSKDGTQQKAREAGAVVIETKASDPKGRGPSLRRGADQVPLRTKMLLFLHVDCLLPETFFEDMENYCQQHSPEIGFCCVKFTRSGIVMKFLEIMASINSVFSNFGDQGIIVTRSLYERIGGFRSQVLLEDVQFFRDAAKYAKIHAFPMTLSVSARKFDERGPITYFAQCCVVLCLYVGLGWSPKRLVKLYNNPMFLRAGSVAKVSLGAMIIILSGYLYSKYRK